MLIRSNEMKISLPHYVFGVSYLVFCKKLSDQQMAKH